MRFSCEHTTGWGESGYWKVMTRLTSEELDGDFFDNRVHLQAHRRGRPSRRLEQVFGGRDIDCEWDGFASRFGLPLAVNMAFERIVSNNSNSRKRGRHDDSKTDSEREEQRWATKLAGECSHALDWRAFRGFLHQGWRSAHHPYMTNFPVELYTVVQDVRQLLMLLADALRQWVVLLPASALAVCRRIPVRGGAQCDDAILL